ncbi:hypothetical protein Gpo141_00011231 [Globisporangium polare]
MSGDASASAHTASRLLQSRVGRAMQRYDGATRLLACVVVLRRAAAVRTKQDRAGSASTACSTHGVNDEDEQVLIISSSKHPDEWILPKGGWESDETLAECALREAEEEAGVAGEVVQELGSLDFASKNGNQCRFHGFQLRVLREFQTWAESNRQRQWVSLADARVHLRHRPELLAMLERALQ